jgi:pimeloyl-ACP methyl ester carboxylesterase
MDTKPSFIEHYVPREQGRVYVREYAGTDPAFVLMHGFPDNLHIYDQLILHLVAAGRRVVTFDFLGFGASDKPAGANYSFKQQQNDLEAVVEALHLDKIVPVGHDAGGPAAINFAIDHLDHLTVFSQHLLRGGAHHPPSRVDRTLREPEPQSACGGDRAKPRTIRLCAQVPAEEISGDSTGGTEGHLRGYPRSDHQ